MSNTPSDAEIEKLAAEHLKAFAQFTGAGDVWVEGEVAFARAVLAKWGTPQPVVQEPLPRFTALRFRARRDKKAEVTLLFQGHETADAWVRGITQKGGINADTRAN